MIADLFKDMSKYLPSQIVPAIMRIITIPIITRLFAPGEYGIYTLVLATVSVLVIIVGWLPTSIIRFYPIYNRDSRLEEFNSTILILAVLSVGIVFLAFTGSILFAKALFSKDLYSLLRIGSLLFVVTAFFEILQYFLRVKRRVGWYSTFSVWKSVASVALGLALVLILRQGIEGLLWGALLSTAVILPVLWKVSVGKPLIKRSSISIKLASQLARYGFPLVTANLAAWILNLSDRYVLEFFRGSHEVGVYSVSYNLSAQSIMFLASLFMLASGPIGMNIWENEGEKASQEFISKITKYYLIFSIAAVVGISALGKQIIRILTVQEYYDGYRTIPFVTLGAFFLGLQQRYHAGLLFYKKTHLIMFSILSAGLLNLGLNFLLVPKYGYMAAAVTTLISYAFLLMMLVIASQRFFVWKFPIKTLGRVMSASMVMWVVVYYVGNSLTSSALFNLIVGICVGVVLYFIMLFLLREPMTGEIQELRNIGNRILGRISR